ncbi:MAG: phage terminase family protein, partial [Enterobacterales bacterium]|nr:phage terminase family protein [Enterobacterales bacterium]
MHPVLTMCAQNAVVVKDAAGNRKLDKSKATGRIDGMVAMTMAAGAANGEVVIVGGDFEDFLFKPLSM